MIKYCPECGSLLPSENAKFCPNCGVNIAELLSKESTISGTKPSNIVTNTEPKTMKESFKKYAKKFGRATGKAAYKVGKFTAQKVIPKLFELSRKQLEEMIDNASEEEDSGIDEGVNGKEFEDIVVEVFQQRNYRILERNYHFSSREIDILATRGDNAVMIECKARSNPVGTAEVDSYISLFKQLRSQRFENARVQKLIIVAPKGGVTSDAKSKAYRIMGRDNIEFWERKRFIHEYEKVKD